MKMKKIILIVISSLIVLLCCVGCEKQYSWRIQDKYDYLASKIAEETSPDLTDCELDVSQCSLMTINDSYDNFKYNHPNAIIVDVKFAVYENKMYYFLFYRESEEDANK